MSEILPTTWNILALLRWTTDYFQEKGVSEPRASAEVLLAHTLGLSRLDLYLRHDQPLTSDELAQFKALIVRRRLGEPVAYLTGYKEFWSLDFLVSPATLIPRPETEVLVEGVLEIFKGGGQGSRTPAPSPETHLPTPQLGSTGFQPVQHRQDACAPYKRGWAIDLGVGSGAVAVALAKELPEVSWLAVDVSAAALAVARKNAHRHGVAPRMHFLQGDLLAPLRPGPWCSLIVANLPYVPHSEWEQLPKDIRDYEPQEALLGGEDGLALIGPMARQAHEYLTPGGWLALEVGAGQAGKVLAVLEESRAYDTLSTIADYQGILRVVRAKRRGGSA